MSGQPEPQAPTVDAGIEAPLRGRLLDPPGPGEGDPAPPDPPIPPPGALRPFARALLAAAIEAHRARLAFPARLRSDPRPTNRGD